MQYRMPSLNAEKVSVDDDEGRFCLDIETDEGGLLRVNIHNIDLDAFYDQVKARLGSYLREMHEARTAVERGLTLREYLEDEYRHEVSTGQHAPFECRDEDIDESGGYAPDDPKSENFHSVHADIWDARAGK